jgi:drug/metabolite transporter (DMT)-like permease
MKSILPILFASIAAIGNALFAWGQKQSVDMNNGLLYVGASALAACLFALMASPLTGPVRFDGIYQHLGMIVVSGFGLFLTYLGFNLLYSQFGVSRYVLYAVISVITTTVLVGFLILKEPINGYQKVAIIMALISVVLFSLGQNKT